MKTPEEMNALEAFQFITGKTTRRFAETLEQAREIWRGILGIGTHSSIMDYQIYEWNGSYIICERFNLGKELLEHGFRRV
jgi:hypothetical protein